MPYFSNKPAPTSPHLLPTPSSGINFKKIEEKAKKRKLANMPDAHSGQLDENEIVILEEQRKTSKIDRLWDERRVKDKVWSNFISYPVLQLVRRD